jgi:hypothetical protein
MGFNRKKRDAFGPRFGELMGKSCHAAITAAYKKNRTLYDREIATIYQMLDTIETETDWNDTKAEQTPFPPRAAAAVAESLQVPDVAPEGERPAESAGDQAPDTDGAAAPVAPKRKPRSPNKGKKRATGTGRTGTDGFKTGSNEPDVSEGDSK